MSKDHFPPIFLLMLVILSMISYLTEMRWCLNVVSPDSLRTLNISFIFLLDICTSPLKMVCSLAHLLIKLCLQLCLPAHISLAIQGLLTSTWILRLVFYVCKNIIIILRGIASRYDLIIEQFSIFCLLMSIGMFLLFMSSFISFFSILKHLL